MAYSAKVLCDSLSPDGVRLTTLEVTLPRIVLAEFNTHRTFSRNSASSRAIPVKKMIERVRQDPFVPVYWGKNVSGMQAPEELVGSERQAAEDLWRAKADEATRTVEAFMQVGLHKQIANRLLEPFLWHTIICSATEWSNFYALRCNKDAQPEIRVAAELMRNAYNASIPKELDYGQWHMPLLFDRDELVSKGTNVGDMCRISVGRCARVSYLTHDGIRDPKADIELCDRLQKSGHLSPGEHVARPMTKTEIENYKSSATNEQIPFCGNFMGFVQYRKTIPYEHDFSKMNR